MPLRSVIASPQATTRPLASLKSVGVAGDARAFAPSQGHVADVEERRERRAVLSAYGGSEHRCRPEECQEPLAIEAQALRYTRLKPRTPSRSF